MATLTLDLSGKGGLMARHWGDMGSVANTYNNKYLAGESQVADGIYNPLRRYGYMSPANATSASVSVDNALTANIGSSIYDANNDDFYLAERGRQIFRGDTLDDTALTRVLDLGATGTPTIRDIELYQINGTRKLFYLYEKSDVMQIGEASLPFASNNDDWLTADVSGAFSNGLTNDAFMRVADNGFMYIFQDNAVHKIDGTSTGGTTGTATANVLLFPTYFFLNDAVDYRGNFYIAVRQQVDNPTTSNQSVFSSKVGVYIWDRQSSVVRTRDYIPLEGVKFIRKLYQAPDGSLRMICVNSERVTEIRRFNGSTFEVIEEPGYLADFSYHDSLTVVSNYTLWVGDNGKIYLHGSIAPGENDSLFKIGQISSLYSVTPIGAILFGGSNTDGGGGVKSTKNGLYIGYINGSAQYSIIEYDLYGTGADGVTAVAEQGDVYYPTKFLPTLSTLKNITIYCLPTSNTGSTAVGVVKVYLNQSTTAFKSKTVTRDEASRGYVQIEINKQYINSVQIEIEFETSVQIGTNDFCPNIAVIEYEDTKTKG